MSTDSTTHTKSGKKKKTKKADLKLSPRTIVQKGLENQPIYKIVWVHRDDLQANNYNPNSVAKIELELLKQSIIEDGWTTALVCRPDNTIVDGFHRYTVSGDPKIYELTDGLLPVSYLAEKADDELMASTIRHNRARGVHGVDPMSDIVAHLRDTGWTVDDFGLRLGMEDEEVERLGDNSGMANRKGNDEFNKGWVPNPDG